MKRLELYTSIVPNARQKAIEEMGFYTFIHFGMNTFTGREWGTGKENPCIFAPSDLDTDQWCEVIKKSGAKGIILTAKHHDGFCLWQTKTTEHSIKNSPYKNGKGDIVKELELSCKKYGLKYGLYLSPWDRNSEYYGTEKYNDFYVAQLEELLTGYGELFTIWLDGACGSHMDGKPMQVYDFERYYDTIHRLQPNCAISNCGRDVRWVGNEGGMTRKSEWNVVPAFNAETQKVMANSQTEDKAFESKIDVISEDLGSRQVLSQYDEFMWYPAEVDVSIRKGWFYHASQNHRVRSINNLLNIYYNSVGGNCMLLLNIPPDKRGRIHEVDSARLVKLGKRIESAFAREVMPKNIELSEAKQGFEMFNSGTYSPKNISENYSIKLQFDAQKIDKAVIIEDIDYSQRIEEFIISTEQKGKTKVLYKGTVVGHKKIALFKPLTTDNLTFTIAKCRLTPYIKELKIYQSDGKLPRKNPLLGIKKELHRIAYRIFEKRIQKGQAKQKSPGQEVDKNS